jgi:8-hydroxy-5-deazaflavin:NADPH oxidoreductase
MRVGIIGAGNIGATLARSLVAAGHTVSIANSRGPETLGEVASASGAHAVAVDQVGRNVDALVLSIPQRAVTALPPDVFAHAPVVIDTNNYYPWRDGQIEPIDNGLPDSAWVAQQVKRRPLVKAFNNIQSNSLGRFGRRRGAADRIALPLSGDDAHALETAAVLVEDAGFDAVIAGDLDASWRQQPGSPVYCTDVSAVELPRLLALADRARLPELRDAAIRVFMSTTPAPTPEQRREIFRRLYLPA